MNTLQLGAARAIADRMGHGWATLPDKDLANAATLGDIEVLCRQEEKAAGLEPWQASKHPAPKVMSDDTIGDMSDGGRFRWRVFEDGQVNFEVCRECHPEHLGALTGTNGKSVAAYAFFTKVASGEIKLEISSEVADTLPKRHVAALYQAAEVLGCGEEFIAANLHPIARVCLGKAREECADLEKMLSNRAVIAQ